jgi:subtilisin family serine protease
MVEHLREAGKRGARSGGRVSPELAAGLRESGKRGKAGRVATQSSRASPHALLRARAQDDAPALLVYVHGIGPQPEPIALKRQWDEALFGHPLGERTRMAYWADILHPLGGAAGSIESLAPLTGVADDADTGVRAAVSRATDSEEAVDWASSLFERMLAAPAFAETASIEPLWREMGAGTFEPRVLPPGRLRRAATEFITRAFIQDVAAYFFDREVRNAIRERLSDLLAPGDPYVLVTHSLGTVITYDVLRSLGEEIDCALWVTLGSPLGIDEVQDRLDPPLEVPRGVLNGKWCNFADRLDPVALDPNLAGDFIPRGFVDDQRVLNPHTLRVRGFNPHSALGYLSHTAVKDAVREVVGLNFSAPTANFVIASDIAAEAVGPPKRHHVLIQLDDALKGDYLEQRRLYLRDWIKELIGAADQVEAAEIDCLQRYVAANLTPRELQLLRAQHKHLSIQRFWKNSAKRALLKTSTHRIQARTAQIGYQATGHGVTWAVLDTGIRDDHPHFRTHGNVSPESCWDCTRPGDPSHNGFQDGNGHGTHVAGIIAGQEFEPADREQAYYGIAPQTQLHVYKVLRDDGEGRDSWIIKALDHIAILNEKSGKLVVHGVNLSLGGPFDAEVFGCGHSPLCEELRRLWRIGVLVCVAAGNEGVANLVTVGPDGRSLEQLQLNSDLSIGDPANLEEAIAVGSVHKEFPHLYGVSYFSSRGPTADGRGKPDVVAPGEKIESCNSSFIEQDRATHYIPLSGTSMACPHVSGLLAAFLSVRREFLGRPDEVKRLLLQHAIDLGRDRYHQGAGMPNLIHMLAGT